MVLREPRAAVFDLDGVLIDTAKFHRRAWKKAFDTFFEERGIDDTFDEELDYRGHVDGRPRYDGVAEFLRSRDINLPPGDPEDEPGFDTEAAIGNLKNEMFNEMVDSEGVDPLPGALELLEAFSAAGVPVAIVSSSRNAPKVLPAQLKQHVDVLLSGDDVDDLGLPGKPDPDMFVEGARLIGVSPAEAAVLEDAPAGVRAGVAGGFAVVVGIDEGNSGHLDGLGADLIVPGVSSLPTDIAAWAHEIRDPRPALDSIAEVMERLGEQPSIFLDYDGTLSPIVDDPDAANLSDEDRSILERLARAAPVAVISGRGLQDVKGQVDVAGITYGGSHGFEIERADGSYFEQPDVARVVPELEKAEQELMEGSADLDGVVIERKPFAIAVHTRRARSDEERVKAQELATDVGSRHPGLIVRGGKEIRELRPALAWDKGHAVAHLLEALHPDSVPMYIGDDETDEDAFAEVRRRFGIGVLVGEARGSDTWAEFTLPTTTDALHFLSLLADELSR